MCREPKKGWAYRGSNNAPVFYAKWFSRYGWNMRQQFEADSNHGDAQENRGDHHALYPSVACFKTASILCDILGD